MTWYSNPAAREFHTDEEVEGVSAFHHAFPGYAPTPLTSSQALADELQVKCVYVKDESARFGLPSFKILGASWAVFQALSSNVSGTRPRTLAELKQRLAEGPAVRLVAATDGNHGRAVAHMARLLGLESAIFVPRGVSAAAVAGIESEHGTVTRVEATYDQTVQRAIQAASEPGSMMIQDTAWPGYHKVPELIVEGYSALYAEIDSQLGEANPPAVVVTPVGVGSLIQASIAHYRTGQSAHPSLLSVEPDSAACVLASLRAGTPVTVKTRVSSMNGLNCGTPSPTAWPMMKAGIDAAVAVTEAQAAQAVHDLRALDFDAGPCGAASLAGIRVALDTAAMRKAMNIDRNSIVVLLSTESFAANPLSTRGGEQNDQSNSDREFVSTYTTG